MSMGPVKANNEHDLDGEARRSMRAGQDGPPLHPFAVLERSGPMLSPETICAQVRAALVLQW